VTIHSTPEIVPKSDPILGSATFTIDVSRITMKVPTSTIAIAIQR
jgi:hypothetical protein